MAALVQRSAYSAFKQRITDKACALRLPINCTFEVTHRCNLRCEHCYVPLGERTVAQRRASELSADQFRSIIDQITDAGCLWIKLTGGEPFVRSDFMDLYLYARSRGMLVTLYTNATQITAKVVRLLVENPPELIEVSLYGSVPAVYEGLTRTPGSYTRCLRGIERLTDSGLPVLLKTPVTRHNVDDVAALRALADRLGLDIIFNGDIVPRLDGDRDPLDMGIPAKASAELASDFIDCLLPGDEDMSAYLPDEEPGDRMFRCAGQTLPSIARRPMLPRSRPRTRKRPDCRRWWPQGASCQNSVRRDPAH